MHPEAILLFALVLPPFSKGVSSTRKEFAPLGANSFLAEWTPIKHLCPPEKKTGTHAVPLITDGKH